MGKGSCGMDPHGWFLEMIYVRECFQGSKSNPFGRWRWKEKKYFSFLVGFWKRGRPKWEIGNEQQVPRVRREAVRSSSSNTRGDLAARWPVVGLTLLGSLHLMKEAEMQRNGAKNSSSRWIRSNDFHLVMLSTWPRLDHVESTPYRWEARDGRSGC